MWALSVEALRQVTVVAEDLETWWVVVDLCPVVDVSGPDASEVFRPTAIDVVDAKKFPSILATSGAHTFAPVGFNGSKSSEPLVVSLSFFVYCSFQGHVVHTT